MAIKFFDCKGYGQIEPNQVWFTRAGMVEAQCALDPEKFASNFPMTEKEATDGKIYGENGAFLMVDKANGIATVPTKDLSNDGLPMGINYSTERIYNQFTPGRRNFCMICGEYYPRIGFVEPGMRITTNAVAWDTTAFTQETSKEFYDEVKKRLSEKTDVYAYVVNGSNGKLTIGAKVADAIGNVYAKVVKAYTNADGTLSFMFQFINKPVA
jgi:hypothetical protein